MNKRKAVIAVVGFGKTGRGLIDFLVNDEDSRKKYAKIILYNDFPIDKPEDLDLKHYYESKGVEFAVGEGNFAGLEQAGVIILSPGVDGRTPRFDKLRDKGSEILSEIEFAFRLMEEKVNVKVISVTGTNGKSTTVSLIHHILVRNGIDSHLLGNIGKPLITEVHDIRDDSVVVLELSSFQLEEVINFRSYIAVLLNVTPDHLDRYSSPAEYLSAKLNIFKNQEEGDHMILNLDDPLVREKAGQVGLAKKHWFTMQDPGQKSNVAFIKNDEIILKVKEMIQKIPLTRNPLRGNHNLENLMAATTAAAIMGLDTRGIESAVACFKGLPHRMEPAGKIGRVEFINDSKATNVDATLKSITGVTGPLVLILGGKDKGGDFTLLKDAIEKRVDHVLLIGKASRTIYEQLPGLQDKFVFVKDLAEAAARGYEFLEVKGGVVLLAPACASFDMFDNFEHRGEVFKKEVEALKNGKRL